MMGLVDVVAITTKGLRFDGDDSGEGLEGKKERGSK